MTIDRNGRSHRPAGRPDGGQWDSGHSGGGGRTDLAPYPDDPGDDPDTLAALADAMDPYEARPIEFTFNGRTIRGWAVDDGRVDDTSLLPPGWARYGVMEDDDAPGYVAVREGRIHVNHRMDAVLPDTTPGDMDLDPDSWGFADDATLAELIGDPESDHEERVHATAARAAAALDTHEATSTLVLSLRGLADRAADTHPDNPWYGEHRLIPTSRAPAILRDMGMEGDRLSDAMEYGGYDPHRHAYAHFTPDGDLEGFGERDAYEYTWEHRADIIERYAADARMPLAPLQHLLHAA